MSKGYQCVKEAAICQVRAAHVKYICIVCIGMGMITPGCENAGPHPAGRMILPQSWATLMTRILMACTHAPIQIRVQ